jgi:hypothetical protein
VENACLDIRFANGSRSNCSSSGGGGGGGSYYYSFARL